jgi:alpha-beta hydrolase superfamily lysophospholipase
LGIRRAEGNFEGAAGMHLFRRSWLPDAKPERGLVLVHGFAEHSGRYEHVGRWFAERACAVHAYDHRGHGRSRGARNHVDGFDDYLDDLAAFVERVREEDPGRPLTLVGHSMGGLIATAFARERKPDIFALVTSGAALALGPAMTGLRLRLARLLRRIAPRLRVDAGLPVEGLSRDPAVVSAYQADPLVDTRISVALALEMMSAIARTAGGGAEIEVPMLLLHGGDDPLCRASGSEEFFASLSDRSVPPSALRIQPGLKHEIFNEPEHPQIFDEVLEWLLALEAHGSDRMREAETRSG